MVRVPVEKGSNVVVYGAGGVGLSVMIGAKANGAAKIIAVDINPAKLENAKALGLATHTVLAGTEDTRAFVLAETGNRGADYAFDAVGLSSTTEEAMTVLRSGGDAIVIGHADGKIEATIDTVHFLRQKKLTGTFGGSIDPHVHIPRFIEMHETGKIDLSCLMDREYALEDIAQPGLFAHLDGADLGHDRVFGEGALIGDLVDLLIALGEPRRAVEHAAREHRRVLAQRQFTALALETVPA
jgi:Zn-dependent alcohol dehydrogenase